MKKPSDMNPNFEKQKYNESVNETPQKVENLIKYGKTQKMLKI